MRRFWQTAIDRARCAWHVLRGRPLIYNLTFEDGLVIKAHDHIRMQATSIVNRTQEAAVKIVR